MVEFQKLNKRIELIKLSIDCINDSIQLESDKLLVKWLKQVKVNLEEVLKML